MKTIKLILLSFIITFHSYSQSSVTLNPVKDNTLFSQSGSISNGAGDYLFFGRTNGGDLRRAVMAFDIASVLQPGDNVVDVFLNFEVSKVPNTSNWTTNAHRITQDWGEGSSDAAGQEGTGTTAATGDATWTQAFFGGTSPIPWNNAGGDFDNNSSGSISVGGLGPYSMNSTQMTADVQNWLDNPSTNFGWILIGDEATNASARRINSRENPTNPVALEIRFNRAVGLNDRMNDFESIEILPNPVTNSFQLSNSFNIEKLEILDLNGKKRLNLEPSTHSFSIAELERGIYLLKIYSGNKTVTKKIIKQ